MELATEFLNGSRRESPLQCLKFDSLAERGLARADELQVARRQSLADLPGVGGLICASVWAIASKFILAIGKKHIFNPAAMGVALSALP